MRRLLIPFSWLFRIIVFIRNKLYDYDYIKRVFLNAKVISIGNISAGGTGKTPLVEFLAKYILKKGKFVIIITKGYKRESDDMQVVEFGYKNTDNKLTTQNFGDESIMLMENFSNVKKKSGLLIASENKRSGAKLADSKFKPEVIIIDDGFQHRKINRDLDIVILNIAYKGRLLPAGNFREPYSSTKRADIKLMNYKFENETAFNRTKLGHIPGFKYELEGFYNLNGELLDRTPVKTVAFCGIGDPNSFKKMLEISEIKIQKFFEFPDHYNYENKDIQNITDSFKSSGSDVILTTQKDFVRFKYSEEINNKENNIIKDFLNNYPVYFSKIRLKFLENQDILFDKIYDLIKE